MSAEVRLLDAWEAGASRPALERARLLASVAVDLGVATPAQSDPSATIGQRDRAILELHRRLFGASVSGTAACPVCGERLEVSFALDEVLDEVLDHVPRGAGEVADRAAPAQTIEVAWNELVLRCRPLRHEDVASLAAMGGLDPAGLARRSVVAIEPGGGRAAEVLPDVLAAELPDEVVAMVAEAVAAADPGCDLSFRLDCLECGAAWEETFDPPSFLWSELDRWARRALEDVHRLATAYGWREADVFALSPHRRRAYLELVGS